jgi:hypothetical protein
MVIDTQLLPFIEWFPTALFDWALRVGALLVIALVLGYLIAAIRHGLGPAVGIAWKNMTTATIDLLGTSPRRVLALSWLSVKEAIRRRVVIVFAVFVAIMLFAGWFLDPGSRDPARLYLSFVLTATSYLTLILALFLSTLSLPTDIRNKTLHTVVTKPVRTSEIVLGRIVGFTVVGTVLLAIMGTMSYVFVVRGLDHTHVIQTVDLQPIGESSDGAEVPLVGESSRVRNHRHKVYVEPDGTGRLEMSRGHWHPLSLDTVGDETSYEVGSPEGMLTARVPIYGKLRFKDRSGKDVEEGINVGDEWTYRSFLEGGTLAAAIWSFEGITERDFPDGLPLELTIGVFRSRKGDIESGIPGSISIRNPETGKMVEAKIFTAKEFTTDVQFIPRELRSSATGGETVDLFDDLVADGKVEVWLRCIEPAQYFGAGQADLYIRADDAPFWLNVVKGYLGIWMQMLLVIGFGVMFSTFLSGPVAVIATIGILVGGFFREFMAKLAAQETYGGGPVESLVRMVTQMNTITELEPGARTTFVKMADRVLEYFLGAVASVLPDFGTFSFADYVANGFNIPLDTVLLVRLVAALGILIPLFIAGHFFLKTREVAR